MDEPSKPALPHENYTVQSMQTPHDNLPILVIVPGLYLCHSMFRQYVQALM